MTKPLLPSTPVAFHCLPFLRVTADTIGAFEGFVHESQKNVCLGDDDNETKKGEFDTRHAQGIMGSFTSQFWWLNWLNSKILFCNSFFDPLCWCCTVKGTRNLRRKVNNGRRRRKVAALLIPRAFIVCHHDFYCKRTSSQPGDGRKLPLVLFIK